MFAAHPQALEKFTRLPAAHQREHLKYILEAKKPITRQKRFDPHDRAARSRKG